MFIITIPNLIFLLSYLLIIYIVIIIKKFYNTQFLNN